MKILEVKKSRGTFPLKSEILLFSTVFLIQPKISWRNFKRIVPRDFQPLVFFNFQKPLLEPQISPKNVENLAEFTAKCEIILGQGPRRWNSFWFESVALRMEKWRKEKPQSLQTFELCLQSLATSFWCNKKSFETFTTYSIALTLQYTFCVITSSCE